MNRNGISTLESVIAVLLLVILGGTFWKLTMVRSLRTITLEAQGERVDLANTFRQTIDCGRTFEGIESECTLKSEADNYLINLRDASGTVIVSKSTSLIGIKYRLKAKCIDLGSTWGIAVEAHQEKNLTTGSSPTFNLFPNYPLTCGKNGNRLTPTCPSLPLPTGATLSLNQTRNFSPGFPKAGYDQFMSTPVVGQLMATGFPSIVANGFMPSSAPDAGGGHLNPGYTFAFRMTSSGIEQHWSSPVTVYTNLSPAIADINNDGVNEVLVVGLNAVNDAGVSVYALNGRTGAKIWSSKVPTPEPGDTSGLTILVDGVPQFPIGKDMYGVKVADLNYDGLPEVILGNAVLNGQTGQLKFWVAGIGARATIAKEINPNEPGMELIGMYGVSSGADGHKICTYPKRLCHPSIGKLHPYDSYETIIGAERCQNSPLGSDEPIFAYRSDTCALLFTATLVGAGSGAPTIGNFDDDEFLEFGMAGRSYYTVFDSDGTTKWSYPIQDASSESTGSTLFDLNGDGKMEVIYNDETTLRIFEGATGRVIYSTPNSSGTIVEYPVVADVNDDGHADIIVAANDYAYGVHKGIRIFTSPANDWIPARRIWNQHAYYVTNVKDNGSAVGIDTKAIWSPYINSEAQLGFHNNLPMRKMCAPTPPACTPGSTYSFATKEDVTTWINDYYGYEAFKNTSGTNSYALPTAATKQRICEMKGFNSVNTSTTTTTSFFSCSGDNTYEWAASTANWNMKGLCLDRTVLNQLQCGCI